MNRIDIIKKLIDQVNHHTFFHLHKDRQSGEQGCGWAGGVLMYSPNRRAPEPVEHALWMKNILSRINEATTKIDKADIANEILAWGGMRIRVTNKDKNFDRVLMATANANEDYNAPMNSSYTKIAALFGYNLNYNTIWDSRVSSAVCYRLALIAEEHKIHPNELHNIFPDLGYIPGRSKRYERRQLLLKKYWTSVYGKWSGHRAGAILLSEISTALVQNQIPTPREVKPLTDIWNSWLVNMVFFIDDLPYQTTSSSISKKKSSTTRTIDLQ
jgi:hypothetical protein